MLDYFFLDVLDEYETGYLFYCEHIKTCSLMITNHTLRYLKGTVDYGLKYEANQKINLGVMWIRIGQAVPLIGRALRGAASVWD